MEIAFGVALIVSAAALTAISIVILQPALRRYALARPNARSSHKLPTPQGAGIAAIAATLGVASFAVLWTGSSSASVWMIFVATVLLASVGAVDDIYNVKIGQRLILQTIAIAIVIAALPTELRVMSFLPWWIERLGLVVALLWFVNLTNFMDGIDWMTVAEVVPVAVGLTILGLLGALPGFATIVALTLAGAMLGFAPFNRPVARVFLGDVGSLPIGLLLGWLLVLLAGNGHWAAALLLPLYYVADATISLIRRIIKFERFWEAHRSHFYQRAHDGGLSVWAIVGQVFAVNVSLVAFALVTVVWPAPVVYWTTLTCGAALVGWLLASLFGARSIPT